PPAGKRNLHSVRPPQPRLAGQVLTLLGSHEERARHAVQLAQRAKGTGRQTLVIAPAARHVWFARLATEAGLRVHTVSAERSPSDQRRIAHDAATGLIDVLVATRHAVGWPLYALGLLVVDDPLHQSHADDQRPYLDTATIALLRFQAEGGNLLFGLTVPIPAMAQRAQRGQYPRIAHQKTAPAVTFVRPAGKGRSSPELLDQIRL